MTTRATITNESNPSEHARMVKVTKSQSGHDTVIVVAPGASYVDYVYSGQSLLVEEGELLSSYGTPDPEPDDNE